MSLCTTCKELEINPEAYLRDVLDRISTHPASRIEELLPDRWKPLREASPTFAPASKSRLFFRVALIFQSLCDCERRQLQVLNGCMISWGTLSRRYSSKCPGSGVIPLRMRSTLPRSVGKTIVAT